MALILASASPRRRELLATLGLPFAVEPPDIDEDAAEADPERLATRLALRKARAVAVRHPADAVIGADTVVVLEGRALGKPRDAAEAAAMLAALRGRGHRVFTGVAVVAGARSGVAAASTDVTMRDYGDDEIARYIARGEPFDKAGGYAIQDPQLAPVAAVEGCTCVVVGLPLWTLRRLLREVAGLETPPPDLARCRACPLRGTVPRGDA